MGPCSHISKVFGGLKTSNVVIWYYKILMIVFDFIPSHMKKNCFLKSLYYLDL